MFKTDIIELYKNSCVLVISAKINTDEIFNCCIESDAFISSYISSKKLENLVIEINKQYNSIDIYRWSTEDYGSII